MVCVPAPPQLVKLSATGGAALRHLLLGAVLDSDPVLSVGAQVHFV